MSSDDDRFISTFRGRDVHAGGFGGAKLILAMKALDALREGEPGAASSESADDLERLLRVQRAVAAEDWLRDRALPARALMSDAVLAARASAMASDVAREAEAAPRATAGSHSSAVDFLGCGVAMVLVKVKRFESMRVRRPRFGSLIVD